MAASDADTGAIVGGQELPTSGAGASAAAKGSATATTTAPTPAAQTVTDSVGDPEFQLTTEVLYHGARQGFLLGAHRVAMFLTIIFGAAVTVPLGGEKICGLLAAAAAAADMAFDFVGRAQAHADIKRRYFEMVTCWAKGGYGEGGRDFAAEWLTVSADEPPKYRTVELVAFRHAAISLGRRPVPDQLAWCQRLSAHFWRG